MTPFQVQFRDGASLFDEVVYAAKKAVVSGQLRPGDRFPSVRALSKDLKIHPGTAQKIVAQLASEGLVETRQGAGTVVGERPRPAREKRARLLGRGIEELVVEAKWLGVGRAALLASVAAHWKDLGLDDEPEEGADGGGAGR